MKLKDYFTLFLFIVICQLAGLIGSLFTFSAIPTWYAALNKPSFNPPNYLFGPVWTLLYLLMGISAYLIYRKGPEKKNVIKALKIFEIQLILNAAWSIIFFGLKNPEFAFIEIVFMWILILITIIKFWNINKTAALLLVPYIMWVTFASALNLSIAILN